MRDSFDGFRTAAHGPSHKDFSLRHCRLDTDFISRHLHTVSHQLHCVDIFVVYFSVR